MPIFINKDANYDEKINAYNKLYQVRIALYHRAGNALNEAEITNAFEKGPANFFTNCGKFAAQMQLVSTLANKLGITLNSLQKLDANNTKN